MFPLILTSCFGKKQMPEVATDSTRPKHFLEFYYPKATYTPGVYDGNPEPPYPDLDEDVKTLEGIDADKDGLRDDLEIWINRISKDENERNLWRQTVRMKTGVILSKESDKDKGLKFLRADNIKVACGELLFAENSSEMFEKSSKLTRFILNTKNREKYHTITTNAASPYHGGFATAEESLFMAKCFCQFDISNEQKVKEKFRAYRKWLMSLTSGKIEAYLNEFKVRNERGCYEDFFGVSDYKSCLDVAVE